MTTEEEKGAWALETGLPNDVDGWMRDCRFGTKDEYKLAVTAAGPDEGEGVAGLMFIADLYDEKGELIGSQGYSVGSGWIPSDDGKSMHHPTRKNVVSSSRYGQLQSRVMKDLGIDMNQYGLPIEAASWDNLGFHWMLEEHETIRGKEPKTGLMPIMFLGKKAEGEAPAPAPAGKAPVKAESEVMTKLKALAEVSPDVKTFQKAALRIEAVATNDELMAQVLDDSANGFYEQNKPKP